jgi:hypothetical protein
LADLGPADTREERIALWQNAIRHLAPEEACLIASAVLEVDRTVTLSDRSDHQARDAAAAYWAGRKRIEKVIEKLRCHEYIKSLPDVTFYGPHTFRCPHGQLRKQCPACVYSSDIYDAYEQEGARPEACIEKRGRRHHRKAGGRPADYRVRYLLESVVRLLTDLERKNHWSHEKACKFMRDVLRYHFDKNLALKDLLERWRNLRFELRTGFRPHEWKQRRRKAAESRKHSEERLRREAKRTVTELELVPLRKVELVLARLLYRARRRRDQFAREDGWADRPPPERLAALLFREQQVSGQSVGEIFHSLLTRAWSNRHGGKRKTSIVAQPSCVRPRHHAVARALAEAGARVRCEIVQVFHRSLRAISRRGTPATR